MKLLLFGALVLLPLSGQEVSSLTVENCTVNAENFTADFDVVNHSVKPVHAWIMMVTARKRNPSEQTQTSGLLLTSEGCSASAGSPLKGNKSRHCTVNVKFGEPVATVLEHNIQIKAVLFDDGTAEGDLQLLDRTIQERRMRSLAYQYWIEQVRHIRQTSSPIDQLKGTDKMLSGVDPSFPSELAFDSTVSWTRKLTRDRVSKALQQVQTDADAARALSNLEAMLQDYKQTSVRAAEAFPWPGKPYLQPAPSAAGIHPINNRTSAFSVVKMEEQGKQLHLFVRNDYTQDIVAYALRLRNHTGLTKSFAFKPIPPAVIEEIRVPLDHDSTGAREAPTEISCVIFKDLTADGDPEMVKNLMDTREAHLSERLKIVRKLRAVAALPEPQLAAAVDKLINELAEPPEAELERSVEFMGAARSERNMIRQEIQQNLYTVQQVSNSSVALNPKMMLLRLAGRLDCTTAGVFQ